MLNNIYQYRSIGKAKLEFDIEITLDRQGGCSSTCTTQIKGSLLGTRRMRSSNRKQMRTYMTVWIQVTGSLARS